jgi:hypothetical protein
MVKRSQKDFTGAVADADRAVQLAPKNHRAYLTRGLAKDALNDLQGAIKDYTSAMNLKSDYPQSYFYRGQTNEKLDNLSGAIADYEKALALNPNYQAAKDRLASLRSTSTGEARELFNSTNIYGVSSGPTSAATFSISQTHVVTSIMTYHWNDGRGTRAGTIALRDASGRTFGPWRVTGTPGQGGVPNAHWTCTPNVTLPPGTYAIVDSEPSTWSHNPQSRGRGMAQVKGFISKAS